jgi:hypothetical protein
VDIQPGPWRYQASHFTGAAGPARPPVRRRDAISISVISPVPFVVRHHHDAVPSHIQDIASPSSPAPQYQPAALIAEHRNGPTPTGYLACRCRRQHLPSAAEARVCTLMTKRAGRWPSSESGSGLLQRTWNGAASRWPCEL